MPSHRNAVKKPDHNHNNSNNTTTNNTNNYNNGDDNDGGNGADTEELQIIMPTWVSHADEVSKGFGFFGMGKKKLFN